MLIGILGTTTVRRDGAAVTVGARKTRALLAVLAATPSRPVSMDRIIDALWGAAAPATARATVHTYVADLRRTVEPERARRAASAVVVTEEHGYSLALPREAVDGNRFESTIREAERTLAALVDFSRPVTNRESAPAVAAAIGSLDEALGLWRGEPYADLNETDAVTAERGRLREMRTVALTSRIVARLALGEHVAVAADLELMTAEHPLREQLWMLRALALTRSGRQADALAAIRDLRRTLSDQLGIDPDPAVQVLQQSILDQDPRLVFPRTHTAATLPAPASERTGLVGRDTEIASLTCLLDPISGGRVPVAVVSGEDGSGKTRLIRELGRIADRLGIATITARCPQDPGSPPLWPWQVVLDRIHRLTGVEVPALDRPADLSNAADRFRLWTAIADALRTAARERPLLVVIEDLQWADPATRGVLAHLVDHPEGTSPALVLSVRPGPAGLGPDLAETLARAQAIRLDLPGLTEESVAELAAAVSDRSWTPAEVAVLLRRTGGNPFFVTELAGHDGSASTALPVGMTDAVARRISALPEATRSLLQCAAVIDVVFDLDLLAFAAGSTADEALEALSPARRSGVLLDEVSDQFRFSHEVVRDVVLASVDRVTRTRQHAAIARGIEELGGLRTRDQCLMLAEHYLQAGYPFAAQGWRAIVRAADVAAVILTPRDEARLLEQALDLQRQDRSATVGERQDLFLRRGRACEAAGDLTAALACRKEAATLQGRPDRGEPAAHTRPWRQLN